MVEGANILELSIQAKDKSSIPSNLPEQSAVDVDPAIVSYNRPPSKDGFASQSIPVGDRPGSPLTRVSSDALARSPPISPSKLSSNPVIPTNTKPKDSIPQPRMIAPDSATSATLTRPFSEISIDEDRQDHTIQEVAGKRIAAHQTDILPDPVQLLPIPLLVKGTGKRNRRGAAKGKTSGDAGSGPGIARFIQQDSFTTTTTQSPNTPKKSRGWRQTPLTEEASQSDLRRGVSAAESASRPEALPTKRKTRRHRARINEDQNGWATEEATDIQDMGDFDFEANLSKFDKHGVFNKIQEEDATADADRLVSFNRVPAKLGSASRNLHHTENVLDSPKANGHMAWNSGDSDKDIGEAKVSSVRSLSRASLRKAPSRKGSSLYGNESLTGSGVLPDIRTRNLFLSLDQAGGPKVPAGQLSPFYSRANSRSRAVLRISTSNQICPCLTPLQMAELEQLAMSELGLTEDIITENASRGIAETARKAVMAGREQSQLALPGGSPLVVILVGNNKSGSRAVAAGRQLRNHGFRVIVCVLGLEREDDLLDSVRRQLTIYRNCGGHVTKADGLEKSLKQMQAPTELIVDALLGMHLSFDDLRTEDQTFYIQLATWANTSEAVVLAIDVPSGLDASSGTL